MTGSVLRGSCAVWALVLATAMPAAVRAQTVAPPADATAATEADDPAEIVITGSFIRGTREDAAVPVDVFTAETLVQQGISSPLEFIKQLPSVGAVLGDSNQFSTASQGFQGNGSINLRGLGPTRTLVLFNGRRTIQAPGDGFTDTNLVPFFALSQIEILKDGAAATYGSDAIAGVANFITRRDFQGVTVQGDYELIDGSDGNWTSSILAGAKFGRLNIMGGFGWQHRSELGTTARQFTRTTYQQNPQGWSALGTPGNFAATYLEAGRPVTVRRRDAGCAEVGGVVDGPADTGLCRFSFVPFDNLIEEEDRYQGYLQANIELSDTLNFHVEGLYAQTDLNSLGYSPSFPPTQGPRGSGSISAFTVSPNNPGVPAFLAQTGLPAGTAARPLAAVTAVVWRPLGWLGNPLDPEKGAGRGFANNTAYRISGGFEKEFSDSFRGQLYGTYWRSERNAAAPDVIGTRMQNALNGLGGPNCNVAANTPGQNGCLWFNPFVNAGPRNPALNLNNPFYVPGAENTPELLAFLQVPVGTRQVEEQYVVDLVFSGETKFDLGGGPIGYAFGAQYRKNDYFSRPLSRVEDLAINPCFREGDLSCVGTPLEGVGPFIFLGGSRLDAQSQKVYALFAEVKVPITSTLEVTGAARYEDYGSPVGSTFNPKGSVRWEPVDWLVLRGSISTTFKAPLATQVSPNFVTALAGIQAAANNFKSQDIFGNPTDLGPEEALTYNVGAVINTSGFTASIDYWSFDFRDRITTTPVQAIASAVASGAVSPNGTRFANCSNVFADLITFQGGCVQGTTTGFDISRVRTDWVNGPKVKTSGIDVAVDFKAQVGPGEFAIGAQASYVLDYTFGDFVFRGQLVQPGYKAKGFTNYFRDPGTISPLRAIGYVSYNVSGLNVRYQVRYVDGVEDDRCINLDPCLNVPGFGPTNFGAKVKSFTQHDINFNYDLPFESVKAQLQFGIENFTNADPPASRLEVSYDPFIGNPFGRIFRFGIRAGF